MFFLFCAFCNAPFLNLIVSFDAPSNDPRQFPVSTEVPVRFGCVFLSGGKKKLRSRTDGAVRAAIIRAAFRSSNLVGRQKRQNPKGSVFFVISVHFRYHFSATENDLLSFKNSNISFASFDGLLSIGGSNFYITKLNLSRYLHSPYVLVYYLKFYPFSKIHVPDSFQKFRHKISYPPAARKKR